MTADRTMHAVGGFLSLLFCGNIAEIKSKSELFVNNSD